MDDALPGIARLAGLAVTTVGIDPSVPAIRTFAGAALSARRGEPQLVPAWVDDVPVAALLRNASLDTGTED